MTLKREILATAGAVLLVLFFVALRLAGYLSHQALAAALFLGLIWALLSRIVLAFRKRLDFGLMRAPFSREQRLPLGLAACRAWTWTVVCVTTLIVFPRADDISWMVVAVAIAGLLRIVLELLPAKRTSRGATVVYALAGLLLSIDLALALWPPVSPEVVFERVPFHGEWLVLQAGRVPLVNHHSVARNQLHAVDFVHLVDDRLIRAGSTTREGWHSWEQDLFAPSAGTVVTAADGTEDGGMFNLQSDKRRALGNHVVLEVDGRFVVFAHLRNGSVEVSAGQALQTGDKIGQVGNSGNTTAPHLHFQVQTHQEFWHPQNRSLPFAFGTEGSVLRRNDRLQGR